MRATYRSTEAARPGRRCAVRGFSGEPMTAKSATDVVPAGLWLHQNNSITGGRAPA